MIRVSNRGHVRPAKAVAFTGRILCTPRRLAPALVVACVLVGGPGTAQDASLDDLRREHARLLEELARHRLQTPYVVIDTHDNRLLLRTQEGAVLRSAVCATGAARRFEGPKSYDRWHFATPHGRFAVLRKAVDPLWVKPRWAFVEAGEDIPVFAEDKRRFQRGVLGRYALYFAKDYMIHGTLYEVNLGKSITHGCVRIGSEDLEYLYRNVEVGWPVYIY